MGYSLPEAPTTLAIEASINPYNLAIYAGFADGIIRRYFYNKKSKSGAYSSLFGHKAKTSSLVFSPDGRLMASGDGSGLILVWKPGTGKEPYRVLRGHTAEILQLAFNRDGSSLLSLGGDETVRLWDIVREREVRTFREQAPKIQTTTMFAWSAGRQRGILAPGLLTADGFGIWDGQGTGTSVQFSGFELTEIEHGQNQKVAQVLRGANSAIFTWDPFHSEEFQAFGEQIRRTALTSNRRMAFCSLQNEELSVRDLQAGVELKRFPKEAVFLGDDSDFSEWGIRDRGDSYSDRWT